MAGTQVLDVVQTLQKVCNDFDAIKQALIEKGVAVDDQTGVSQYAEKIKEIQGGDEELIAELEAQITELETSVESLNATIEDDDVNFTDIYNAIIQKGSTCDEEDKSTYAQGVLDISSGGDKPDFLNEEPTSLDYAFSSNYGHLLLPTFTLLSMIDTSQCTSMKYVFNGSEWTDKIDLSTWDFTKATSEQSLFQNAKVSAVEFPQETPIKNANNMFSGCTNLVSIDGSLNLSQCSGVNSMFYQCTKLEKVIISDFSYNTNQVLDLSASAVLNVQVLLENLPQYSGIRTKTIKVNAALVTTDLTTMAQSKGYTLSS